jgi:hypothetical protein
MADNNLLWQAIDYVAKEPGISVSLDLTRFKGIVASRSDMDQAQESADVSPGPGQLGIYDKLLPILAQWKQQFNFVGSYYVDIGNDPANEHATNWAVSAPYYAQLLAMGNELGTHRQRSRAGRISDVRRPTPLPVIMRYNWTKVKYLPGVPPVRVRRRNAVLTPLAALGLAIIMLTILLKAVTFYPTQRSLLSAKKMQKLGPKMAAIRKKFENDKQRCHEVTYTSWRRRGFAPRGSMCRWGAWPSGALRPGFIRWLRRAGGGGAVSHAGRTVCQLGGARIPRGGERALVARQGHARGPVRRALLVCAPRRGLCVAAAPRRSRHTYMSGSPPPMMPPPSTTSV